MTVALLTDPPGQDAQLAMIDRRNCLRAALFGPLALLVPPGCRAEPGAFDDLRALSRHANGLFGQIFRAELAGRPELVTRSGLEMPGALARLDERSQAGFERTRLRRIESLRKLEELPLAPQDSALRRDQVALVTGYRQMVDLSGFGHGRVSQAIARPYVIDQISGGWREVPDLLITRQPVSDKREAMAYLSRLSSLADTLDDERRRLMAEAEAGIVPPEFILEQSARRIAGLARGPAAGHPLVITFEDLLTGAEGLTAREANDLRDMAVRIMSTRTLPAYQRLAEASDALRTRASNVPGVWNLPDGDAYYDALLALYTHQSSSAEEYHRQGQALVAGLSEELDPLLRQAGLEEGSVSQRLARLSARDDQKFTDDGAGRRAFLDELDRLARKARRRAGAWIARLPDTPLAITPLPGALDWGLGEAVYRPPTASGTRPGTLYVSTADLSLWPRFALPALVHHETVPGHHAETSLAMDASRQPDLRRLFWPAGYGEGWATYAETLADEAGLHEGDTLARIGYLQSQLLRAARLVADTGLHRMRWERSRTIDYMVQVTGMPRRQMTAETDRMAAWPGQAASYMAGKQFIQRLRERAEGVLGKDFDPAGFHHTLLAGGPRPLDMLRHDLESWYEAQIRGVD